MPATYERVGSDDQSLINAVMEKYHGPLWDIGTTVQAVMASPPVDKNGDPTGPAIKLHGVKAYATIRTTRPKERAMGACDLEITIDKDYWDESDDEARIALIDHELMHKVPKLDKKTGAVRRDDRDRPLFATIDHDVEVGWFFAAARRHGMKSIECQQLRDLLESDGYKQSMLPAVAAFQKAETK